MGKITNFCCYQDKFYCAKFDRVSKSFILTNFFVLRTSNFSIAPLALLFTKCTFFFLFFLLIWWIYIFIFLLSTKLVSFYWSLCSARTSCMVKCLIRIKYNDYYFNICKGQEPYGKKKYWRERCICNTKTHDDRFLSDSHWHLIRN